MIYKKRINGIRKNQQGFTLLEVLISVSILSIGLLGIATMQDVAFRGTIFGSRMSIGTNLADEMMERIRFKEPGVNPTGFDITDYDDIDTSDTTTRPPAAAWQARGDYDQWRARILQYLPDATGTVTVTTLGDALGRNDIQVQVSWPGVGRTHSITMTTTILS